MLHDATDERRSGQLGVLVIYHRPDEFPTPWALGWFDVIDGMRQHTPHAHAATLDEIRAMVPPGSKRCEISLINRGNPITLGFEAWMVEQR